MKVAKFGGSSVANGTQIKKVAEIIKQDQKRKFVVVSAPGKRYADDVKITDLLIAMGETYIKGEQYEGYSADVLARFKEIINELELDLALYAEIEKSIKTVLTEDLPDGMKLDRIKALGEDNSAKIVSSYLCKIGLNARYINPKEAGIIVSDDPGNAQILPESFDKIYQLRDVDGILVIPGFFGYTKEGKLVTFSRGGSDITGAIIAAGVKAEMYENFTDVNSVYTVNPAIVNNPKEISVLTYREMRELSYAGFSVFHDEALIPAIKEKIPICIKNTNNPKAKGTFVVAERELDDHVVSGIASDSGFVIIYVSKYLMNREIGFGRKLLQILEDERISFEHAPSGIDDMSVIIRERNLPPEKEEIVLRRIKEELHPDTVSLQRGIALIMVVGEGLVNTIGVAKQAVSAISNAKINIEMINQGSSEVSMMFGIKEEDLEPAVRSLYQSFFE